MSKTNILQFLSTIFDNKMLCGTFSIPDTVLNKDLKMLIMDQIGHFVDDYKITFNGGFIFLQITLNINTIGKLNANYRLCIEKFVFKDSAHKISFSYSEDVKSMGNLMQNMALKAASVKGSYLKTALDMGKTSASNKKTSSLYNAINADDNFISVNLDDFNLIKTLPSSATLKYVDCQNGRLKFQIE